MSMLSTFDFSVLAPSLPFIYTGLLFSLKLTLIAMTGGIIIGTLLALARLSSMRALSNFAAGYVNLMRSIPLVMVILWFFLVIPLLTGQPLGAESSALVTFTAFESSSTPFFKASLAFIPKIISFAIFFFF